MIKNIKILLVEDEIDICDIVKENLELNGYTVNTVLSAEDAMKIDLSEYDLFILDIMLEVMTGTELARIIRNNERIKNIPIIFLTAKGTEDNKLEGFEIGADDYITKPFSINELIARVKAVLKRSTSAEKDSSEGIIIDESRKVVIVNGQEVILTKKEYLLLEILVKNKRILFSRTQLLDIVWEDDGSVTDRAVDVMVRRVRKKMGDLGNTIKTRSGLGYTFDPS